MPSDGPPTVSPAPAARPWGPQPEVAVLEEREQVPVGRERDAVLVAGRLGQSFDATAVGLHAEEHAPIRKDQCAAVSRPCRRVPVARICLAAWGRPRRPSRRRASTRALSAAFSSPFGASSKGNVTAMSVKRDRPVPSARTTQRSRNGIPLSFHRNAKSVPSRRPPEVSRGSAAEVRQRRNSFDRERLPSRDACAEGDQGNRQCHVADRDRRSTPAAHQNRTHRFLPEEMAGRRRRRTPHDVRRRP